MPGLAPQARDLRAGLDEQSSPRAGGKARYLVFLDIAPGKVA
jgi:hypothetical protein